MVPAQRPDHQPHSDVPVWFHPGPQRPERPGATCLACDAQGDSWRYCLPLTPEGSPLSPEQEAAQDRILADLERRFR